MVDLKDFCGAAIDFRSLGGLILISSLCKYDILFRQILSEYPT